MRKNREIARQELMEEIGFIGQKEEERRIAINYYIENTDLQERVPLAVSVYNNMRRDGFEDIDLNEIRGITGV